MDLFYRENGKGIPVIILHGLFGSSDNWLTLMKKFANNFHVFAIDQRNHGQSFHSDRFDYQVMSDDLLTFYKQAGLKNAVIIGHSMGGKTAMRFALDHPDQVTKLIVVDIAPRSYPVHHDHIAEALCSLELDSYSRRDEADRALAEKIKNPAIRQFLLKNVERNGQGRLIWKINLPVIKKNLENMGAEIGNDRPYKGPSLFIAGEKSDYIQPSDESRIKSLFLNTRIVYFKNTGHWVHAEAPDRFYETVSFFINKQ